MSANHVLLERFQLSASSPVVTFANLPQTGYKDLKVVVSARGSSSNILNLSMTINNDSTSSYNYYELTGNGSALSSGNSTGTYLNTIMPGSSISSNSFSSNEIYLYNYTSSLPKAIEVNSVTENNSASTDVQVRIQSWGWTKTESIKKITFFNAQGANFVAGSTFSIYGVADFGTNQTISPKATGGDIITNDGDYWYHAFLATGAFRPRTSLNCDILVVAGGGAGGAGHAGGAGGGGAGGLLGFANQLLPASSYICTVGAGGSAGASVNSAFVLFGNNGSNSQFGSLTAAVGGGGGAATMANPSNIQGNTGGSGGGTAFWNASTLVAGGQGTSGQGYSAGQVQGPGYTRAASGGGGAGASSGNVGAANSYDSTAGGIGATYDTSVGGTAGPYAFIQDMGRTTSTGQLSAGKYYYAGGGGGANAGSGKAGGVGGGGAGYGTTATGSATSGTANTGGGGGGASSDASGILTFTSGSGGSGIVIVRYPMA